MSNPRVFGLPHLSEDAVAAFADGVLSAAATSRAQRHCAECAECADAVRGQRETAMLLRTAQAPALPSGLLDRLAGLPMSASLPPPRGGLPTVLDADGTAMFVAYDVHRADLLRAEESDLRRTDQRGVGSDGADQRGAGSDGAAPRGTGHRGDGYPDHGRPPHRRGALPVTVLASAAAVVAAGTLGGHVSTLAADRPTPAGAASVAGSLAGTRNVAVVLPAPLAGTGTGSLLDVSEPAGSQPQTWSAGNPQAPTAVTLTPARRPVWQPGALAAGGRLPAGLPSMLTGLPTATP